MRIRYLLTICMWLTFRSLLNGQGVPAGYYDQAVGLSGPQLKTALHQIIKNHSVISYTGLWTAFYTTDDKPTGKVWDIYSDNPDGTPPYEFSFGINQCSTTPGFEGSCYNREHTFYASWFGGSTSDTIYTDLFHLLPADSYVNSRRSNYPYGEVSAPTWTSQNGSKLGPCSYPGYSGTVFEPLDAYKGDLARHYFYLATRYESEIAGWETISSMGDAVMNGTSFPCFEPWFLNMLGEWHMADPVSQKEIDRNNTIYYDFQHNRNPYIDHPEYVYAVWGIGEPVILPEPGHYPADFSARHIHLQWSDATGTVLPTGYLIRMSAVGFGDIAAPADGLTYSSATDFTVPYGRQELWIKNLEPATTYYFKMYSFTGSGATTDYKTDGEIPQLQQATAM